MYSNLLFLNDYFILYENTHQCRKNNRNKRNYYKNNYICLCDPSANQKKVCSYDTRECNTPIVPIETRQCNNINDFPPNLSILKKPAKKTIKNPMTGMIDIKYCHFVALISFLISVFVSFKYGTFISLPAIIPPFLR